MAGWEELLLEDMGRLVSRAVKEDVKALWYSYEDASSGGCDTCGPDPATVMIAYHVMGSDDTQYYWRDGSLGELLDELRNQ